MRAGASLPVQRARVAIKKRMAPAGAIVML